MAVLMFLIVLLAPEQLLGLLSSEPLVIAEGVRYFQIIRYSYIIFNFCYSAIGNWNMSNCRICCIAIAGENMTKWIVT